MVDGGDGFQVLADVTIPGWKAFGGAGRRRSTPVTVPGWLARGPGTAPLRFRSTSRARTAIRLMLAVH